MSSVRGERVDALLARVERHRPEAAILHPVSAIDRRNERRSAGLERAGRGLVAAERAVELGRVEERARGVALHLDQRDRRLGEATVAKADRVSRVLPPLVLQAVLGGALVLEEAVAVAIGGALDPPHRGDEVPLHRAQEGEIAGATVVLGEQQDEERRGVDAAEIGEARGEAPRADQALGAQLVQDLPGLLLGLRIILLALPARERSQDAAREIRQERARLQRGEERVAPEERHEPGDARGEVEVVARALEPRDAQRVEILDRPLEGLIERGIAGAELGVRRRARRGGRDPRALAHSIRSHTAAVARRGEVAVGDRVHIEANVERAARPQRRVEAGPTPFEDRLLREAHLGPAAPPGRGVEREREHRAAQRQRARGRRRGERRGLDRSASR